MSGYTYGLAVGFIERTLLFNFGQLHVDLLTYYSHGVSSYTRTEILFNNTALY